MKKTIFLASCLCLAQTIHAAPIEQRNLSTPTSNTTDSTQQNMQIWELKQQVQQLQNQVRLLVGKLEEKEHQVEQLEQDLQNRYVDLDQRLQLLSEQINPPEADNTSEQETTADLDTKSQDAIDVGSDQAAYNAAYEAYQKGGAAKAIEPMQSFINNFPNSAYISHAYYWLGEFNLSLTPANIHEARDSFEVVAGNYPQSNKAPAAVYRLIEIALNIDKDVNKARTQYQHLIQKYPTSQEARSARSTFAL